MPRVCPVCGRPVEEDSYPFCSSRCRVIDLGNWLSDGYRVSEDIIDSEGLDADTGQENDGEE